MNILIAQAAPEPSPIMAFLPIVIIVGGIIAIIFYRKQSQKKKQPPLGNFQTSMPSTPTQDDSSTINDIYFECPKCSQALDAPREMAAQLIECPNCKETIEVPVRSPGAQVRKSPRPAFTPPAPVTASLTKCPSCRADVSTEAAACPKCGHQFKYAGGINLKDPVHVIGLIITALLAVGVVWYILAVTVIYH